MLLLETAIRQRSEQQRKAGAELDATCQLCLKTKFADGLGHACHYCNVRCCARCGGKVALRSSKVPSIYPPAYCSLSPIYLFSLSLSLGFLYIFAPVSTLFNRWLAHGCFTCASAVLIASSLSRVRLCVTSVMLIPRVTAITSQLIGAFHSSDKTKKKNGRLAPTSSFLICHP